MTQKSNLESSLKEFATAVENLHEKPQLERALHANILSIRILELFRYEKSKAGQVPPENLSHYKKLARICLREFQQMIPYLNGETRHIDLYFEQMRGRINLVNRVYVEKRG